MKHLNPEMVIIGSYPSLYPSDYRNDVSEYAPNIRVLVLSGFDKAVPLEFIKRELIDLLEYYEVIFHVGDHRFTLREENIIETEDIGVPWSQKVLHPTTITVDVIIESLVKGTYYA
jgi:hypothetical protein